MDNPETLARLDTQHTGRYKHVYFYKKTRNVLKVYYIEIISTPSDLF